MSAPPRPRVAVVTSHPIQYHSPWFRGLSEVLDLQVFYAHRPDATEQARAGYGVAFDWDVDLLAGHSHVFLRNVSRRPDVFHFGGCDTPEIGQALARGPFDALIVTGWYLKSYWQAIAAARRHGIPVLVRGDSQLGGPRPLHVRVAKELAYRWVMGRFAAFLVVGERNRRYVMHYGARAADCYLVPHFVDNVWFRDRARQASGGRGALRASLGARESERLVLFVGRLLPFKRPLDLVDALAVLQARGAAVRAVFVGAGPLEQDIRTRAERAGVAVHLAGFRNQSELPALYGAADCLVLASDASETWGLVANEAMACGLPVALSDQVGSAPDLVREGRTGSTFPCGDIAACADAIERTLALSQTEALATGLAERLRAHSCEAAVEGTLRAVAAVRDRRDPRFWR